MTNILDFFKGLRGDRQPGEAEESLTERFSSGNLPAGRVNLWPSTGVLTDAGCSSGDLPVNYVGMPTDLPFEDYRDQLSLNAIHAVLPWNMLETSGHVYRTLHRMMDERLRICCRPEGYSE